VDQIEVEKLIGELETLLDRLRSLYEQYFVGIERIEPGVVRKDVDRRLYVLRKEQIRNTALRYRFQMVLQKYNTYQTHWQRVCREIENGTYKRHLMRAQRRFGSSRPPRRRTSAPPPPLHPEPGALVPKDLAAQLAELDNDFAPPSFDVDVDVDVPPSGRPSSRPPPRPSPRPPAVPGQPGAPVPARPVAPGTQPVWKKVGAPGAPPNGPATGPTPAVAPPPVRAVAPAGPAPASPPGRAAPPAVPSAARPVRPGPPPPAPLALAPPAPAPLAPAPPAPPPRPRAPDAGPPAAASRAVPPRASPSVAPPRPSLAPSRLGPSSTELSEKRLRQIYVEYVDAKRRQNESTAAITYQSVAKSLRESGDRLREKHGKAVDFEVAVKDGKTILRPVLK